MKTAFAKTAWLSEPGARLDATYHLSEGRQAKVNIESNGKYKPLASVTERIFLGGRFRRVYVEDAEKGYPYLTASDMIKAEPFSNSYLSKKHTRNLSLLTIQKGWILLSCSGSIGRTVYTNEDFEGQVGTHDLIRIVADQEQIHPGYLYAFLSSKYGYSLLTQGTYGGVIQHIEPHHIANLPVPLLLEAEQKQIHEQIEEASRLRVEANRLLNEAVTQLEEFLPVLEFKGQYVAKSSSFGIQRLRLDATVQLGAYQSYLDRAADLAELKSVFAISKQVFTPDIFKRIRVKNSANGVPFLSGTNLLESQPKFDDFLSRKSPKLNDYLLREGWLALQDSGSISSIGYVSLIPRCLDGAAATNNLIRIIPIEDNNHNPYLLAYFKTKQGQQILKSLSYGTGQLHIDTAQIAKLIIPIYRSVFEDVTKKVLAYSDKFNRAYELEHAAITHIEWAIESWQEKP